MFSQKEGFVVPVEPTTEYLRSIRMKPKWSPEEWNVAAQYVGEFFMRCRNDENWEQRNGFDEFAKLVLEHFIHFDLYPKQDVLNVAEWELDFDRMDRAIDRNGNQQVTLEEIKATMGARGKRLLEVQESLSSGEEDPGDND